MNHDVPPTDATIVYYDGDYPSLEIGTPRGEDAAALARIGLLGDVPFYRSLAAQAGGPVLEVGAGTGRLTIPLARAGIAVTAVDISAAMLDRMAAKLAAEPEEVRARVRPVLQDAASLDLAERSFRLAIIPFNVLMLIPERELQRRTLAAVAAHLPPGARLALDVMNPLTLPLGEETTPQPSQPRRNPRTGNAYVKNSLHSRMDEEQVQRLHGWYGELLPDGRVEMTDFSFRWRIIFRFELDLMLEAASFEIETIYGGFDSSAWTVDSSRIIVIAQRR